MPGIVGHQLHVTTNQFFIGWRYCTAGRLPVIKSQIQEGKKFAVKCRVSCLLKIRVQDCPTFSSQTRGRLEMQGLIHRLLIL
jgi:hypothetical protein